MRAAVAARGKMKSPPKKHVRIEVKLGGKKTEQFVMRPGADPKIVSVCFAKKHSLGLESAKALCELVQEKLGKLK